ncbi:hypothetical protein [Pontibacter sp. H249]
MMTAEVAEKAPRLGKGEVRGDWTWNCLNTVRLQELRTLRGLLL